MTYDLDLLEEPKAPELYEPPAAVTARPAVAWTWQASARVSDVVPGRAGHNYAITRKGVLTDLENGRPDWTVTVL